MKILDHWFEIVLFIYFMVNELDRHFWYPKRAKRQADAMKKVVVDGILEDLKDSDSVIVIQGDKSFVMHDSRQTDLFQ